MPTLSMVLWFCIASTKLPAQNTHCPWREASVCEGAFCATGCLAVYCQHTTHRRCVHVCTRQAFGCVFDSDAFQSLALQLPTFPVAGPAAVQESFCAVDTAVACTANGTVAATEPVAFIRFRACCKALATAWSGGVWELCVFGVVLFIYHAAAITRPASAFLSCLLSSCNALPEHCRAIIDGIISPMPQCRTLKSRWHTEL